MTGRKKVRVLVVDDSAIARDLLERGLSADPGIEVVGKASDAFAARDKIVFLKPDVMTLDVEMPRMDGIEFLKRLIPQYPIPTVVVSAVTAEGSRRAMDALAAGALEVVGKPSAGERNALMSMIADLAEKVKAAAGADPSKIRSSVSEPRPRADPSPRRPVKTAKSAASSGSDRGIIAIGASTGGTTALHRIIEALPPDMPPIVVVQHMPPVFTRMFSAALDRESALDVVEAEEDMGIASGTVYIAPGDKQMRVLKRGGDYRLSCAEGPKVSGHRPSADVLFSSVADSFGASSVGVLLTGMGRDGADGLLAMRRSGARCLAQDEESSVVWGMPREAWECGAAERLVPLDEMAREIVSLAGKEASWASRR